MATGSKEVTIAAPNFQTAAFRIRGTAPYVQNKFSAKAKEMIRTNQEAGSTGRKGSKRDGKNFQAMYKEAMHVAGEGWFGIPAPAFRSAMISACRTVGFKMTLAKLSIFVQPDGFDADDGTPLVRITKGEPQYHEAMVRLNAAGTADLRPRPMWTPGWEAEVKIIFDADQFTIVDVTNLLVRVGLQVGIGEGRPDSKMSTGMGWGTFEVLGR